MAFLPWETSGSPCKRERERVSMKQIAVVSARKVSGCPWFSAPLHCHNPAYRIQITPASTDEKRNSPRTAYVPSLFVWNVMSLAPKVDELRHLLKYANLDLVCITESWLSKSHIHDNVVALESYNIIRRNRTEIENEKPWLCICTLWNIIYLQHGWT